MKLPWKKWFSAVAAVPDPNLAKNDEGTAENPDPDARMQEVDRYLNVDYGAPSIAEQQIHELLAALTDPLSPAGAFRENGVFMVGGAEFFGPFESWEDSERYKKWWVKHAPATWLTALLQAGLSLQKQEAPDQKLQLSSLLHGWVTQHPDAWPQIMALTDTSSGRSLALSVWAQSAHRADETTYQEFVRWSDNLCAFSEDEIIDLIDGFWSVNSEESRRILKKIGDFLPEEMRDAKEEMEIYKKSVTPDGL